MNRFIYTHEHSRAIEQLQADVIGHPAYHTWTIREQLDRQAQRLVDAGRSGSTAVHIHLRSTLPETSARDLTLDVAREAIAREHGFANWPTAVREGGVLPDAVFEAAVEAVIGGDVDLLNRLLVGDPTLVWGRSAYGHQATLLHYLAANGVELYRQRVPSNAAQVADLLLASGADPQAKMPVYGGAYTVMDLLESSDHPVQAGVVEELAAVFANGRGRERRRLPSTA